MSHEESSFRHVGFARFPVDGNPVSQGLANQGKKLFAALALMVRLPNV